MPPASFRTEEDALLFSIASDRHVSSPHPAARALSAVALALLALVAWAPAHAGELDPGQRATIDRYRMIGAAHYENDTFDKAAEAFRQCLAIDPASAVDQFNLGLVEMRAQHYDESLAALDRAESLDPSLVAAVYVRGIVYTRQSRYEEAVEALTRVTEADPQCFGAYYNLGVSLKMLERFEDARDAFARAIEIDPLHPSAHYQMIVVSRRLGDVEQAARHAEIFDRIKDTLDASEKTVEALERSRYSYVIETERYGSELEPEPDAEVSFVDTTPAAVLGDRHPLLSEPSGSGTGASSADSNLEVQGAALRRRWVSSQAGALALADIDQDGLLDIYVVGCETGPADQATTGTGPNRLYLNRGPAGLEERAAAFGVTGGGCGLDAVLGDLDGDSHDDLYIVNDGPNMLLRRLGDGVLSGSDPVQDEAAGDTATADSPGPAIILATPPGLALPPSMRIELELEIPSEPGPAYDGMLVLDYTAPDSFKYVGARAGESRWVIGHYDGAWHDDAQVDSGIATDEPHALELEIAGGRVELLPGFAGADTTLVHDFGEPLEGAVGLATDRSSARFDALRILKPVDAASGNEPETPETPESPERYEALVDEGLADGIADGFTIVSGSWQVLEWGFEDVSTEARADEPQLGREAVLIDYDHDNDLDIFVVNGADLGTTEDLSELARLNAGRPATDPVALPEDLAGEVNTMLRNSGTAVFTDLTDQSGLLVDLARSRAVLAADLDTDHDLDLLVANEGSPSRLFLNQRLGKLAVGGSLSPDPGEDVRDAVTTDLDRDGRLDLVLATGDGLWLYLNKGADSLKAAEPAGDGTSGVRFIGRRVDLPPQLAATGIGRVALLDVANDGWPDLMLVAGDARSLAVLVGAGPERFVDRTRALGLERHWESIADVAAADLDGDGDQDLVVLDRALGLHVLDNRARAGSHFLSVELRGKKVNHNGLGATVEVSAGGHYQMQSLSQPLPLHFGLGELDQVSVVRVTWPNGVAQNVIEPVIDGHLVIPEHVRVSASCGFLWAFDGTRFKLINEILGIGPLGAPIAPGVYYQPDSTELTMIDSHDMVPIDGSYELRLTEELRELMFADMITLRVLDHPAELEIVPNEMFTAPPFPEDRFFALADARPPAAVVDDDGRDVRDLVLTHDGRYPEVRRSSRYDGLAELHTLTIDLGDVAELNRASKLMLFLDGWIYWPDASTVIAMDQDPDVIPVEPSLEVLGADGTWRTALPSVGLPTSKGLVVPVDLSALLPLETSKIRLVTNVCLYWDRIFLATSDQAERCRVTELPTAEADLHYRGFSRLDRDDLGYERFDYADVDLDGPWSPPVGMLTRYGPVEELLQAADDRYVIFGPGDELALRFDASHLPELPPGWSRTLIFYAGGWVKDGDLNTALSATVEPLPFHGMSGYPYGEDEHYPDTPVHREYQQRYNTRPAVPTVGQLTGGS